VIAEKLSERFPHFHIAKLAEVRDNAVFDQELEKGNALSAIHARGDSTRLCEMTYR